MEAVARLRNVPTSPRKMRLVADLVRGHRVAHALNLLRFEAKHAARDLEKTLLSAVANWQVKNGEAALESADLYIKHITIDGGSMLKRLRPAPQGRAHRIRKRSNHITIIVDSRTPMAQNGLDAGLTADEAPVTQTQEATANA